MGNPLPFSLLILIADAFAAKPLIRHNNARDPVQREHFMQDLFTLKSSHFMDNDDEKDTLECQTQA
jgi:hypothetical protein